MFPWIGSKPIASLTAPDVLAVLRRIDSRCARETAHRASQSIGATFRYAIATGRATVDPTPMLRGAIPAATKTHFASITEPAKVGELLRTIESYAGEYVTRAAPRLAPLVFVRPGELRQAEWQEMDLDNAEWRIPAERMKMKAPHIVPLSTQAVAILKDLQPLTGRGRYVFPSVRTRERPMSENTVNAALRRLGYEQGWRPDAIERQLAHAERNEVRAAYNYAEQLPERKRMLQAWADYLDGLRTGAKVITLKRQA